MSEVNKGGRPRLDFDLADTDTRSQFIKMVEIQCTAEEIASVFNVSADTLDRRIKEFYGSESSFAEIYKKHSARGKSSLRRYMFKMAEKNPTMAIWLSKQHLGMKDRHEIEQSQVIQINIDKDDLEL